MTRKAICKREMKMSWTLFHELQMSAMLQLKGLSGWNVTLIFELQHNDVAAAETREKSLAVEVENGKVWTGDCGVFLLS